MSAAGHRFLLLLCLCFVTSWCAQVRLPLKKIQTARQRLVAQKQWGQFKHYRSKLQDARARLGSTGPSEPLPLYDFYDVEYVTTILVGTPPQEFNVLPDTGSALFWLPDASCGVEPPEQECADYCQGNGAAHDMLCNMNLCTGKCCASAKRNFANVLAFDPCDTKRKFDSSLSNTYITDGRQYSILYDTGADSGFIGRDVVVFGETRVEQQSFGQATHIADLYGVSDFDGVLGLAWPQLAPDNVLPLMSNIMDQNLTAGIVGVYMAHANWPGLVAGELALGGYNDDLFDEPIFYQPVTTKGLWQIQMDGVRFGREQIDYTTNGGVQAASDTGTGFLIGPAVDVANIAKELGSTWNEEAGLYLVDCNTYESLPPIRFVFQGKEFPVAPQNYVYAQLTDIGFACYLALDSSPSNPVSWILGAAFIRDWYQIYDFDGARVGFAKNS